MKDYGDTPKSWLDRIKINLEVYISSTAEANPEELYSYVRKKKVLSSTIGPLSLQNGQLENDEKKMADLLNEYFASVFTKEDISGFQEEKFERRNLSSLNSYNLSENVLIKTLEKQTRLEVMTVLSRVS